MKPACLLVRSLAPSAEGSLPPGRLRTHTAQCLACQAELARYSRLRRQLASLATVAEPVPSPLAAAVGREISRESPADHPSRRGSQAGRVAAAGGAVAAAAAGAAAVIKWRHSKAAV